MSTQSVIKTIQGHHVSKTLCSLTLGKDGHTNVRVATHMLRHYIIIEYVATREDLYLATHSFFILWVAFDTLEGHADL